jgi:pimeloyl-ACP methyl ester carboxylesterase
MKKSLVVTIGVVGLVAAAAAGAVLALSGSAVDDPASARCDAPPASFGRARVVTGVRQVEVRFTCSGARLAGTLYLPKGPGPHPAVIWVAGSGPTPRLFPGAIVTPFLRSGTAVFSYDKRGVGESEGRCCPGDDAHYNLLVADAAGAAQALRRRRDIDARRIGFYGVSQAGWIVPRAAVRARAAFTVLVSAPAVTDGEESEFSRLTGEEGGRGSGESLDAIVRRLRPSGFDPRPDLARMTMPGLWLYGARDRSQPTALSVANLQRLRPDAEIVVLRDAGHGLLDGRGDPRAVRAMVRWVRTELS